MEKKYSVRGVVLRGVVIRQKTPKTAVVERKVMKKIPKYERSLAGLTRHVVHIPEGISVNVGDLVEIGETRKISKTKNFIILSVLKKEAIKV